MGHGLLERTVAIKDKDFWNEEVKEPAVLYVADVKSKSDTLNDLEV